MRDAGEKSGQGQTAGIAHETEASDSSAVYARNIKALAGRLPGLAALVDTAPASDLEIFTARSGVPSARLGGLAVHSAYDPRAEAEHSAATLPPLADSCVLAGFGLGYLAEALLGENPASCPDAGDGGEIACLTGLAGAAAADTPAAAVPTGHAAVDTVIVCESSAANLKAALGARDLSRLLADERLGFVVGGEPDAVLAALDASNVRRPQIFGISAVEKGDEAWYRALRDALRRFSDKESINENTLRRFGGRWVRNLSHNLPLLAELPGTSLLENSFACPASAGTAEACVPRQGLPALVLAAGPSLDEVLPYIEQLRERMLIVCVDTALRSLLRFGLDPDFLVVVDPQYWNWRHLEGLSAPRAILVSESAAWPAVFRFRCRASFLCGSLFPLGRYLETAVGPKGELGAGGSVATSAWDLCRLLGAGQIYMAGLDLSFPGGGTHARASLFEQRALSSGSRLRGASTDEAASLFSAPSRELPAYDGSTVHSDERLSLYAWWFESRLARPTSPRTWNLGSHGVKIPGMPHVDISELLSMKVIRPYIDRTLDRLAGLRMDPGAPARLEMALEELRSQLALVAAAAESAAATAEKAQTLLLKNEAVGDCLARLDAFDARLGTSDARDVIGFLLPPLSELIGFRPRNLAESLAQSRRLYSSIAQSARLHLAILPVRISQPF